MALEAPFGMMRGVKVAARDIKTTGAPGACQAIPPAGMVGGREVASHMIAREVAPRMSV